MLDISTLVNIVLCILSFILAVISVITVIVTLRQNHQMIENTTRPYLTVYYNNTYFQDLHSYLILKNFGVSSATIIEFSSDCDLSSIEHDTGHMPFGALTGVTLAPGQKIPYIINGSNFSENEIITFTLKYKSDTNHIYNENVQIRSEYLRNIAVVRASTKDKELRTISYALQDIAEKML